MKPIDDSRGRRSRNSRRTDPGKSRRQRRGASTPHQAQRADRQLASQVERVLELCLAGSRNPVLHNLGLHSVMHLDGTLYARVVSMAHSAEDVARHLELASSWLRREIAGEINRKRVPELRFEILADWPDTAAARLLCGAGEVQNEE